MTIFDTHCHYNLDPFFNEWKTYWTKAQESGVTHSTIIGVNQETNLRAINLAKENPAFHAVVGIHPGEYQERVESSNQSVLQSIEVDEKGLRSLDLSHVAGIGETGLDYFRLPDDAELRESIKSAQKAGFSMHIQLAQELKVPLIIHVRDTKEDAYGDVLAILQKHAFSQPFVLHCVSGPLSYIQEAIQLGAYIGLAGNVTYKNSQRIREIAAFAPKDRVLLETDAPFLPPVPHRGKPCEPWMISLTAEYVADELQLDLSQIYENSLRLFSVQ